MGNLVVTPPGFGSIINWTTLAASVANLNTLRSLLGPWRPPQWNQPQLYSLTVTEIVNTSVQSTILFGESTNEDTVGSLGSATAPTARQTTTNNVTYYFDAILRAEHIQDLTETRHPIQTGAAVIDHAYLNPATVTLEIGMSDVLGRFAPGQYTSNSSKSISAYQTFKDIQSRRVPITLSTRLDTYNNMLIRRIQAVENKQSKFGLRAEITFVQIITASVATQTVPASSRPDSTDTTNEGTKQPLTPPPVTANLLGKFPTATF